jgi:hypothetical protein
MTSEGGVGNIGPDHHGTVIVVHEEPFLPDKSPLEARRVRAVEDAHDAALR